METHFFGVLEHINADGVPSFPSVYYGPLTLSVPPHRKTPSYLVFVALFCARNGPFLKNILALLPCSGDPKCPAPPWYTLF